MGDSANITITHPAVQNVSAPQNSTLSNLQDIPYPSDPRFVEHIFLGLAKVVDAPETPYANARLYTVLAKPPPHLIPPATILYAASDDLRRFEFVELQFRWADAQGIDRRVRIFSNKWRSWGDPFVSQSVEMWDTMQELDLNTLEEHAHYFEWEYIAARLAEERILSPQTLGLYGPWSAIRLVWSALRPHPLYTFMFQPPAPSRPEFAFDVYSGDYTVPTQGLALTIDSSSSANTSTRLSDISEDENLYSMLR